MSKAEVEREEAPGVIIPAPPGYRVAFAARDADGWHLDQYPVIAFRIDGADVIPIVPCPPTGSRKALILPDGRVYEWEQGDERESIQDWKAGLDATQKLINELALTGE